MGTDKCSNGKLKYLIQNHKILYANRGRKVIGISGSLYLLRFGQMLKREWGAESNGKLSNLFIPSKTAT